MTTPLSPPPPPPPSAVTRTPLHTRAVTYRGFARDDGLWDIEGHMRDTKDYAMERHGNATLPPGSPAHDMFIRVTLDDALKIVDIQTDMTATPFGGCHDAAEPMRRLIGATLGRGWRKAIDAAIGGVGGCTHLRELLFNLATAAMQTIPPYQNHLKGLQRQPATPGDEVPHFIGKCMSWRRDGPEVRRFYPMLFVDRSGPATEPETP